MSSNSIVPQKKRVRHVRRLLPPAGGSYERQKVPCLGLYRHIGEDFAAILGDQDVVLYPYSADPFHVGARLDCEDHPGPDRIVG